MYYCGTAKSHDFIASLISQSWVLQAPDSGVLGLGDHLSFLLNPLTYLFIFNQVISCPYGHIEKFQTGT